ncbi:hypothetical protein P175DRAFT_0533358 [Aspergillus ochraceoroseus IBT 24754]|uniref:Uncharacterized protein n=1 Tax=Aspergillus ochraceoroseus IBT 24754 TaxID=1392256 RepID=A0A2T5LVP5_9EURO|nr:uncharacterized protein P175DRAFT_0533358 [Aspergillus ochraceoroseus IBT 24754]PTU20357.1 hypothetical protein P175DRAFT_0533358 [Aspergillus ochraceoroseus IBT 24754]
MFFASLTYIFTTRERSRDVPAMGGHGRCTTELRSSWPDKTLRTIYGTFSCGQITAGRLISYPYYAKYARHGDSTWFRHIDINISQALARGRGMATIQRSISLDEEDTDNCTHSAAPRNAEAFLRNGSRRIRERGQTGSHARKLLHHLVGLNQAYHI